MNYNNFLNKIYCGDAEEILKQFPDNFVHLIVTSPPYNVNMNYDNYNDVQNIDAYFKKMERILRECYRILVKGGRIGINLPAAIMQHTKSRIAYLAIDWLLLMRKVGFHDREFITWIKSVPARFQNTKLWSIQPTGKSTSWGSWKSSSNPALRDASELIIIMHKETPKLELDKKIYKDDITKDEFLAWTTNVWFMVPNTSDRKFHPAPFPEELPYRLIKLYTPQNAIVLDPFMGVGNTCVAAKKLKRFYIGIDISQKYCEIAKQRLGQERLF